MKLSRNLIQVCLLRGGPPSALCKVGAMRVAFRYVSSPPLPNPACDFHRTGLSRVWHFAAEIPLGVVIPFPFTPCPWRVVPDSWG